MYCTVIISTCSGLLTFRCIVYCAWISVAPATPRDAQLSTVAVDDSNRLLPTALRLSEHAEKLVAAKALRELHLQ